MNGLFELLLIDRDEATMHSLRTRLHFEDMHVERVAFGHEGLRFMSERTWDLLISDTELPDMTGEELLTRLKGKLTGLPVIMLTTTRVTHRIVRLLRLGATDIIHKPFVMEELIARIWSLLRLSGVEDSREASLRVDDIRIDPNSRTVLVGGEIAALTPTEFDLFLYLVKNEGRPLRREQILSDVWGYDFPGDTNLVDVYIRYLRVKLDRKYKRKRIRTVRGVGYMFKAD